MIYRLSTVILVLLLNIDLQAQIPARLLPDFEFERADKSVFSNKALPPGKMIFFAFFDPECDHCQQAVRHIGEQSRSFQKVFLCLVSEESFDKMNQFIHTYAPRLKTQKNLILVRDISHQFLTRFKPYRYPAMYLYSADKKLLDYEDNEESVFRFVHTIQKQLNKK